MLRRDIVVIGGSAGAIKALQQMVARLPGDLAAGLLVTTHLGPSTPDRLADILARIGTLPAVRAADGMQIGPGQICTAIPDRHLLIGQHDRVRLSRGPRQNRVRPAVDTLFRSAARWCGPRVIGVVLSGGLDDGAAGLAAIVEAGGVALVQQPEEAGFGGMPRAALQAVPDAVVLPAAQLARVVTDLVGKPVEAPSAWPTAALIWETDVVQHASSAAGAVGQPAGLGCPECSGGMNAISTGNAIHYVCHAGHSYSPQSFLDAREDGVEAALWTALSAMQEKAMVLQDMASRAERVGDEEGRRRRLEAADQVRRASDLLREHIVAIGVPTRNTGE